MFWFSEYVVLETMSLCCETCTPPQEGRQEVPAPHLVSAGVWSPCSEAASLLAHLKSEDELPGGPWVRGVGAGVGWVGDPVLQEFPWEKGARECSPGTKGE